jgi:hypothetical protein
VSEQNTFYIDNESQDNVIAVYQNYDGKKRLLINIRKESGLLQGQDYDIVKLDVRPQILEEATSYRFLVQI